MYIVLGLIDQTVAIKWPGKYWPYGICCIFLAHLVSLTLN